MYAVIQASGRQYRVSEGDIIQLQRIPGEAGDPVEFPQVLLLEKDGSIQVGQDVKTAKVTGKILSQELGKKVRLYRYKRRKNTQRTKGHRPKISRVAIEKIEI